MRDWGFAGLSYASQEAPAPGLLFVILTQISSKRDMNSAAKSDGYYES
jgi:hypothetical protein